jgi:uncharacterized protein YndB with AHSA1/START domain
MTTPDVPLRMELTFEMPGTPAQVWDAIATANGITAWMMPTDMEEREGGAVAFHMGETASEGTITGWEPPRRIVYEEPDWAALGGHEGEVVTPLVTEFLVEAQSGGTCLLRVVSSAFGTGADWEQEFFDEMVKGWTPMFEHLRLYLTDFPGQRVTSLWLDAQVPGTSEAVRSALRQAFGVDAAGQPVEARGLNGHVHRLEEAAFTLRLTDPIPGFISFWTNDMGDGKVMTGMAGYLFSDDAPSYVEREQAAWKAWLENLAVPAR